jgi:hypothetical protein
MNVVLHKPVRFPGELYPSAPGQLGDDSSGSWKTWEASPWLSALHGFISSEERFTHRLTSRSRACITEAVLVFRQRLFFSAIRRRLLSPACIAGEGSALRFPRDARKERLEMDSARFDALTKALATPTSRRQALQRIGGTLTGAVLAAFPFEQALAKGGGNSACAHFCDAVFGADTPAASQCISDAAHGKGLCHQCGSAAPSSLCCTRNSSGYCSSYRGTHCPCPSSQVCQNGTCAVCANPSPDVCTAPACGNPFCGRCLQSVEGGVYCSSPVSMCATCASDSDCFTQFGSQFPICVSSAPCVCGSGTVCAAATC